MSDPPQTQPHQTLPSVSQRTPSVKPGAKSANCLPPVTPVPELLTSNTVTSAGYGPSVAAVSTKWFFKIDILGWLIAFHDVLLLKLFFGSQPLHDLSDPNDWVTTQPKHYSGCRNGVAFWSMALFVRPLRGLAADYRPRRKVKRPLEFEWAPNNSVVECRFSEGSPRRDFVTRSTGCRAGVHGYACRSRQTLRW